MKTKSKSTKKKKPYPIVDEHRRHYVRYPIKITADMIGKASPIIQKKHIGMYMFVEVLKKGYMYSFSAAPLEKESDVQRGCDIHNRYHGWSKKEVIKIITKSMNAK